MLFKIRSNKNMLCFLKHGNESLYAQIFYAELVAKRLIPHKIFERIIPIFSTKNIP